MQTDNYIFGGKAYPLIRCGAVVVGSGAASLNAADELALRGVDVLLVTEGMKMGTSRNTGSDKQTYYKLQLTGADGDSVGAMAKTLHSGGSMKGELALCEAASSARAFFKLVSLGVPFPENEYGEFVGYQTDHDETKRATACGPLTSKYMTEALERSVLARKIPIFDGARVISILTDGKGAVSGVAAISRAHITEENPAGLIFFAAASVLYGVGGPSAIYASSVYPESQTCAHGAAFEAGAAGVNLTESQYGIASLKFRWNLSGSYQQVLPRYFSMDAEGNEYDFLSEALPDNADRLLAIFLKGYQWPFDPARADSGSSRVDLAIFDEVKRGRRVFLDYTKNDAGLVASGYPDEARVYLENSGALADTPIKRLLALNKRAYELYLANGIDLARDMLEIGVCAQHNNGGLEVGADYMSPTLRGFYPIGEAAGVFGIRRPGGSALNSTQVSSMRAAISASECTGDPREFSSASIAKLEKKLTMLSDLGMERDEIIAERMDLGRRMDSVGAFIRGEDEVRAAIAEVGALLDGYLERHRASHHETLRELTINYDILTTQYVYLSAILEYIERGGLGRGSYMIKGRAAGRGELDDMICRVILDEGGEVVCNWFSASPIPESEQWFERVYNRQKSK